MHLLIVMVKIQYNLFTFICAITVMYLFTESYIFLYSDNPSYFNVLERNYNVVPHLCFYLNYILLELYVYEGLKILL